MCWSIVNMRWSQHRLALVACFFCVTMFAVAVRGEDTVSLVRVVLTENPESGKPASEFYYEGKFTFEPQKPLELPFHAEDMAQVAKVEVRLGKASEFEEIAPIGLKVVSDASGLKLYYLTIQPRHSNAALLDVSVRIPNTSVTDAVYSQKIVAELKGTSDQNRVLRRIVVTNNLGFEWGKQDAKIELLLKTKTDVFYRKADFSSLKSKSKRTFEEILAADVDVNDAYIDLGQLLSEPGGIPMPETLSGLPEFMYVENGNSSDSRRITIPAGDVELKWSPDFPNATNTNSANLSAELPLGPKEPSCDKCCCATPAEFFRNKAYLRLGTDSTLTVPRVTRSVDGPWMPLAIVGDEIIFLNARGWELCVRNGRENERRIHFFQSAASGPHAFSMLPILTVPGSTTVETVTWSVATKVESLKKSANPAEFAKAITALKDNFNKIRKGTTNDALLQPFLCLSPDARKAIKEVGLPTYLENLSKKLQPLAASAKKFQDAFEDLSKTQSQLESLQRLARQLTDTTGNNPHWRELLRIKMCREDLERNEKRIQEIAKRALAILMNSGNLAFETNIFAATQIKCEVSGQNHNVKEDKGVNLPEVVDAGSATTQKSEGTLEAPE